MSRRKKPYLEALKELMADAERLDFFEKHCAGVGNHISLVDGKWSIFIHDEAGCGMGDNISLRPAIDEAIAKYKEMVDPSFRTVLKRMKLPPAKS